LGLAESETGDNKDLAVDNVTPALVVGVAVEGE
jgi:hypothetical protein